eukprot:675132-Pelagomonas_calceolata.AAC.4
MASLHCLTCGTGSTIASQQPPQAQPFLASLRCLATLARNAAARWPVRGAMFKIRMLRRAMLRHGCFDLKFKAQCSRRNVQDTHAQTCNAQTWMLYGATLKTCMPMRAMLRRAMHGA